ncbi:hypothetical protein GF339_15470 [candidate division KSB3 bacterium]|uniref:Helicase HerA barrel domain-containing protein n=1 Tax=candidate division KSB3 bacterium TaxID=2044937 RepID=A0A9D5JXI6_9BACT|nr:hypothetical protein [candidate division KSB3 bacterium]MBD3325983.1 hypothetical protein [candidate division KSB3 bacterium]
MSEEYIAEVIESSTTEFTAQTRELDGSPPFGAFVKVGTTLQSMAMIYQIATGSADLNRRPIAYGKTEEELRREQPQIFELLRTEISAKIVGYWDEHGMKQTLPPQPPRLHSFVYPCPLEEVQAFTAQFDYLRTLAGIGGTLSDELLIAAIQQTCRSRGTAAREWLIRSGKELSRLLRDDYDRLESILRRIAL